MEPYPWKILLVEDDEDDYVLTRDLLREALGNRFELFWVVTAEAALQQIAAISPDAILVDYRLGAQNGLDLIRQAVEGGARAPVILLSGQGSYEVDLEAMRLGAADYLSKRELTASQLERTLRYSIERRRAAEALQAAHDELERRVQERTRELQAANEELRAEIAERQRAQQARRKSEERLRLVVTGAPVALWAVDRQGRITLSEGMGLAAFDRQAGQAAGQSIFEIAAGQAEVREGVARSLAGEEVTVVSDSPTESGEYFESRYTPQYSSKGEIDGVICVSVVVTERVKAEAQQRQIVARTAALAELSQALAEAGPDHRKVLDIVTRRVAGLIDGFCLVTLLSEDEQQLIPVASHHPDPQAAAALGDFFLSATHAAGAGLRGQVIRTGKAVLLPEVAPGQTPLSLPEPYTLHSLLIVPLRAQGKVLGTLGVSRQQPGRPYTPDDQAFMQDLADRAALAIANARLFHALQDELAERMRAEAALRASSTLLERLFESTPDVTLLVDETGRIRRVNRRILEKFGYQPDELVGKPIESILPERFRDGHQGYRVAFFGDPETRPMGFGRDLFGLHKDGRELPIDASLSPLYLEDEQNVICVIRDITERLRAEEALRQSEARFRTIFEEAAIGIELKGLDGSILESNPAFQEMLGYTNAELRQMRDTEFTDPADVHTDDLLFASLVGGLLDRYRLEKRYRSKDGSLVWVRLAVSLVLDQQGAAQFAIELVENITERKQMEAGLAEVQRRLMDSRDAERLDLARELHDGPMQELYGVSYQLKAIQDELAEVPPAQKLDTLQAAIREVVQMLRVTCGELRPPTLAPFGLERTIRSHADRFRQQHPELELALDLTPDGQQLPDSTRMALFRIYQQSLANVVRHAGARRVRVRFALDAEQAYLEVSDDGKGFDVPVTWLDFVREGHLGLAGIYERVEAIGGKLHVDSNPGRGTTLQVSVPRPED